MTLVYRLHNNEPVKRLRFLKMSLYFFSPQSVTEQKMECAVKVFFNVNIFAGNCGFGHN